ncbi:bifunctional methionine sulfoxide reductase B/A protein [Bacteroidota bacterium]
MKYNKLTKQEENIIIHKGTEAPFSGQYVDNKEKGTYTCKHCNNPLFYSDHKFESNCGWPSFDDEINGAIIHQKDSDGKRTEILCSNCGGHLGHMFFGEGFTNKNLRHCVNSLSMNFMPSYINKKTEIAYFAGGCFWGTEHHFQKAEGVVSTSVGYIGGDSNNPTYEEVCSGKTGHAEVVEVIYDPEKTDFEKLAKLFFEIHDFTQINQQGPDIGDQYRTEIFYTQKTQLERAGELIKDLEKMGYNVATKISVANKYWKAEDYHQDYYSKTGSLPYCHIYRKIF